MSVTRVLLTGFEAFGASERNPSAELAHLLAGATVAGTQVSGVELPVTAAGAPRALQAAIERYAPEIVLSLGLANGRSMLALERAALNVLDFPMPDSDGFQATGEPVLPEAPAAYFASLPIKAILARWREEGVPGYVSNTAGTYVCNQTFFTSLHLAAIHGHRAGLIHVPYLPEQAAEAGQGTPSMALELMLQAVRLAIEVSVEVEEDIALAAGAIS